MGGGGLEKLTVVYTLALCKVAYRGGGVGLNGQIMAYLMCERSQIKIKNHISHYMSSINSIRILVSVVGEGVSTK